MSTLEDHAKLIPRSKKEQYLAQMSEDAFRDEVVRPLFLRIGYLDGGEYCGPTEQGKDALFIEKNLMGLWAVVAVQTKKGNLNLASKATQNIETALTQLRTACNTTVIMLLDKKKVKPSKVLLCASGKINDAARRHIVDEVRDPRIDFLDIDDIIPRIDAHYPELWLGIDAELAPYYRAVKSLIEGKVGNSSVTQLGAISATKDILQGAATDNYFVPVNVFRTYVKITKVQGQVVKKPELIEIEATELAHRHATRIVVAGDGGAGKSTVLKRIVYDAVRRGVDKSGEYTIPILIPAVDVAYGNGAPLVEIIDAFTKKLANTQNACFSTQDLDHGRVVIMVDALDEISSDEKRLEVLRKVNIFCDANPKVRVIITSRQYAFNKHLEELRSFENYSVSPINLTQAEKILQNVQRGKALPKEVTSELMRRLDEVHGIELNPLLVTVFAATAEYNRQDIPANITELFKKFTELMLGRWDDDKGLNQQYQAPLKDFLAQKLAFEMHAAKTTRMPLTEIRRKIEQLLRARGHDADYDQLQHELVSRSGLFRVIDGNVEFRHHLLQEFFAGRAIENMDFIKEQLSDEWWKRPIVFYFGEHPRDVSELQLAADHVAKFGGAIAEASTTIGLALQACYLSEVVEKLKVWRWVTTALSSISNEAIKQVAVGSKYPVSRFVGMYLYARDAVALSNVPDQLEELIAWWHSKDLADGPEKEAVGFWLVSALIEVGDFRKAQELLKTYHPSNSLYFLAIFLGCYLSAEIRMISDADREISKQICKDLAPRIQGDRLRLSEEFKSELLEIRRGRIAELERDLEEADGDRAVSESLNGDKIPD